MSNEQVIKQFESAGKFLEYVTTTKARDSWNGITLSSISGDKSFTGTDIFDQAVKLAGYGWPEGVAALKDKIGLNPSYGRAKSVLWDVAGERPDIARYLSGVPNCMTRRVIAQGKKRPIIDIMINASYSCSIGSGSIMNYGAAMAMFIDEMENNGFSVALWLATATKNSGDVSNGCIVNVKQAGEIVDIDRLIFFIGHPAFLRRLGFRFYETAYETHNGFHYGYGMPHDIDAQYIPEGAIYFGKNLGSSLNSKCATLATAKAWVKEIVYNQRPDLIDTEIAA